jgi:protein subunit release factor B
MPKFGVSEKKENQLAEQMTRCGVLESDLVEKFIRSGGPGGQHVNRTATCVYLKHEPTGHEVKMQKARSQALNRFYARRRSCELIEEEDDTVTSKEDQRREKIRKQKTRRRKKTKKKLADDSDSDSTAQDA